jgi:hypothetical protein
MKVAFMLGFSVFAKNLRLTQRLSDGFLVNALDSMINGNLMILLHHSDLHKGTIPWLHKLNSTYINF